MIPEAIITRVREATDIVELISGYVKLRRRGQNYIALCPFHSEKTPSFNVNPARQIFHCFGCGKGGDVFGFLMEHEHLGFLEAVAQLAERTHIEIPRSAPSEDAADRIHRANAVAFEYFRLALAHEREGEPARAYLQRRKVPDEWSEYFGVGYAPPRRRGLIRFAERHGLSVRDLEAAGLVVQLRERAVDRFTNRLMFPVRNLSGRPIAFGGRDLTGMSKAKYINSPETALYRKGKVLYGLYEARKAIAENEEVLVCEGYFDLLRLHQFGFTRAVAISGTALTTDQARLLTRYARRAVILLDADGPGRDAALRSIPVLFDAGLDVTVASLPAGEDPDTLLVGAGPGALADVLQASRDYITFLQERAGGPFQRLSPAVQDRLIGDIAETVARIGDPVRRDLVTRQAWEEFGVDEQAFRARLAQSGSTGGQPDAKRGTAPEGSEWQSELLRLLVHSPAARVALDNEVSIEDLTDPAHRELLRLLLDPRNRDADVPALLQAAQDPAMAGRISRLAGADIPGIEAGIDDYIFKLRRRRLEERARDLLGQIRAAERRGERAKADALLSEHQRVRAEWLGLEKARRRS